MPRDAEGNNYHVDRMTDTIRRRGENISSLEVERELLAHPAVADAAAVGVPSSLGDREVLAHVELMAGTALEPAELVAFLIPRLAHFMVPRYFRFAASLPRTESGKVRKIELCAAGLPEGCWGREAAGIILRRAAP